jgi:hypothetical protein
MLRGRVSSKTCTIGCTGLTTTVIWVFDRGQWYQDEELTKAVESASWDNLVLEESFVKGLQRDTSTFFSSEKIYKSLGITWKRGILLLGEFIAFG